MSEYQSNTTTSQAQANSGIAPTQESPAQQVKDTYNSSHSGELGQENRENFTGGQQTQGINQAPQSTNVQSTNVQNNVQDNRENVTGGLTGGQQHRSNSSSYQCTGQCTK